MSNILVYDTETSDLPKFNLPADDPSQPYIVQLGAVLCDGAGKELHRFEYIVKPEGWTIAPGAAKVHGISTEHAAEHGIGIAQVLDAFDALLADAALLVCYNLRFDEKLRRSQLRRLGRPDGFGTIPVFCCMKGATPLCKIAPTKKMKSAGFDKYKTPNLGEAVRMLLGREHTGAHGALADALVTKDLYFAYRDNHEFMAAGSAFKTNAETVSHKDATVKCKWCGTDTTKTGTKMCDRCWELDHRIGGDMAIAKRILGHYEDQSKSPQEPPPPAPAPKKEVQGGLSDLLDLYNQGDTKA